MASININNLNGKMSTKLVNEIMQIWREIWVPIYGQDYKGFYELIYSKYGIDIAFEFNYLDLPEFHDMTPNVKERKTIKNVMNARDAVCAGKSSKNHKLKPRESKRDRTKQLDAKRASRVHNQSIRIKFDV